jgi:hypothetical protein
MATDLGSRGVAARIAPFFSCLGCTAVGLSSNWPYWGLIRAAQKSQDARWEQLWADRPACILAQDPKKLHELSQARSKFWK